MLHFLLIAGALASPAQYLRPGLVNALVITLGLIGGALSARGLTIWTKAWLAQVLLEQAWDRYRSTGRSTPPWADTSPIARLRVARLAIQHIVLDGASASVLAFGPGRVSGVPGAHRDTHLRFLEELRPGDEIVIETPHRRTRYQDKVLETFDSRAESLLIDDAVASLWLVTCYPFAALAAGGAMRFCGGCTSRRH